jgi:predicted transposase/invertase (TIGR01784 family)
MEAIEDTLDEKVDESKYTLPAIQRVFKIIEKDQVTPEERAKMFDEYGEEEIKKEGFKDGLKEGITQNIHDTVLRMYKKGLDIKMIAEIAGIAKKQVNEILIKNK